MDSRCWHSRADAVQVQYLEPTPPNEDLMLVSTVSSVELHRSTNPQRRDAVQVGVQLL